VTDNLHQERASADNNRVSAFVPELNVLRNADFATPVMTTIFANYATRVEIDLAGLS
jgi:hypothetical protein